jgi:polyhydroxybutyrate depolymerase
MKKVVLLMLGIVLFLVGCDQATEVPPTRESTQVPTDTKAPPTDTPEPTKTEVPQTIETGTLEFDGKEREYMVFIPDNYTDANVFPLVIYLHSYGWSAQKGMDYTQLNQVGNIYDFVIAYPSASNNWNSGIEDNSGWPTPDINDVGYIDALIDNLSERYRIDLQRIYAAGYSNGGFMAYKLACQLSHRIAAIASVGGVISTSVEANCDPLHAMPVLEIHGTEDPWVPLEGDTGWLSVDQTLGYWSSLNRCSNSDTTILPDSNPTDGCTVEKISFTSCTDNSSVVYYRVINGGHTWPGAGPPGFSAGKTDQDFSAGEEIWAFFKDYRLITSNIEN